MLYLRTNPATRGTCTAVQFPPRAVAMAAFVKASRDLSQRYGTGRFDVSDDWRDVGRAHLRAKVGGKGGIDDYILKPKGMHKRTFERAMEGFIRSSRSSSGTLISCLIGSIGSLLGSRGFELRASRISIRARLQRQGRGRAFQRRGQERLRAWATRSG